ncbi:MAG: cation:proton antiporter [Bacillota bacterium]
MENIVLELGLALSLITLAGLLGARLRLSIVPFAILAGLAVGPHAPRFGIFDFRFIQSGSTIEVMGRLGVMFLLFFLGLEFSIVRLLRAGRSILASGLAYILINFPLGLLVPWWMGWPFWEALTAAGVTIISSSAIVTKMVVDLRRTANPETEIILGLMLFQDLFIVLYLTLVSGLTGASQPSTLETLSHVGAALAFVGGFLALGRRLASYLNRWLAIPSEEVLLVALFAGLTLVAGLAEKAHVSAAVGALLVGLVLAETEHARRIAQMVVPFRDFFGALFFFSFGLGIDPLALGGAVWPALAAVALTVAGNLAAGVLAGRMARLSPRASANIGFTILSRGEFSIIVAGLAKTRGLLPVLQPFAAVYVLVLAVLGPVLTKGSAQVYAFLSRAGGRTGTGSRGRPPR